MAYSLVDLTADTWVKVATAKTTGIIHRMNLNPNLYLQTYRETGDLAPAGKDEAIPVLIGGEQAEISAVTPIDVYLMSVGVAGKVRVDT